MTISVQIQIDVSKEKIWQVIADIENSTNVISGIEKIEILEKPSDGLVGLKWKETRTMFGKTASEIMWITDAEEPSYYRTRAESHGAVYITELRITERESSSILTMTFTAEIVKLGAKIMWAMMGFMMRGSTKKALQQDLNDIKAAAEKAK